MLIYSDPRDDGTVTVENGYTPYLNPLSDPTIVIDFPSRYPHGPARNPTAVQRGSVQFLSVYPGDPTTPGYPSYENSTRTEGSNIPKIPSLPISWANAEVLLSALGPGGKWEGGRVRLINQGNFTSPGASRWLIFLTTLQLIPRSHLSGTQWVSYLDISKMKLYSLEIIETVCVP